MRCIIRGLNISLGLLDGMHTGKPISNPIQPTRKLPVIQRITADTFHTARPQPEIHRVGPEFASWSGIFSENPYYTLIKVGPKFGLTL